MASRSVPRGFSSFHRLSDNSPTWRYIPAGLLFCSSNRRFVHTFLQTRSYPRRPWCSTASFPLPGGFRDFHPIERAPAGRTKKHSVSFDTKCFNVQERVWKFILTSCRIFIFAVPPAIPICHSAFRPAVWYNPFPAALLSCSSRFVLTFQAFQLTASAL